MKRHLTMTRRKKQIRHRSKYLGRKVDGQPVRMRSAPDEVKEKTKKKTVAVKSSLDYGSIFVLQSIMDDLKRDRYLEVLLPVLEVSMVRALAFNWIIRPTAMKNFDSWYIGTSLLLETPQINLTIQRVSELLGRLGESNIPDRFIVATLRFIPAKPGFNYTATIINRRDAEFAETLNLPY